MGFLTAIAFVIFFIGWILQSGKDNSLTAKRKAYAIEHGECYYTTANKKRIHIETGKTCNVFLLFSPDHKESFYYCSDMRSGKILGGQRFNRFLDKFEILSASEVTKLIEEGWH